MGDNYNNNGNNFGHMGPVHNYGNQRLAYSEAALTQLLRHVPEGKVIELHSVGSQADHEVGDQFQAALEQRGFVVERRMIGTVAPPPAQKITVTDRGDKFLIMISPAA